MTKIKICGIKTENDCLILNEVLPDFAGFVFAKSKRQIDKQTAKKLKHLLNKKIQTVGVFVNESPEIVFDLANDKTIDIVQLHGDEDESYMLYLKTKIHCPIIKAIRVKNSQQILDAQDFPSDYLLFDTYTDKAYGGIGECFEWSLIPKNIKPFFLAGGLTPENVSDAIKICNPYCVDVSSGVENCGEKSKEKIINFVNRVRSDQI